MDKKNMLRVGGQLLMIASGVVIGTLALEFAKRKFVKADFTKPLEVKKEE